MSQVVKPEIVGKLYIQYMWELYDQPVVDNLQTHARQFDFT